MRDYTQYFEKKTRDNGETFYFLKESEWKNALQSLIHDIHKDHFNHCMPHDWIYYQVHSAFCDFVSYIGDDTRDFCELSLDVQPDIYTNDLLEWAKYPMFREWIETANSEIGRPETFEQEISQAQFLAIEAIYNDVWEFMKSSEKDESAEEITNEKV